ncbi:MAG: prolipoprotein diacylglyceryl transferase [Opitutales bacterium]|nr:prolipoprotein diacylglyceryl transferase [Opitutales bacterium]
MNAETTHGYWVHDLSPFLIRFSEDFGLRYYSLAYIAGFAVAYVLFRVYHRTGRSSLDPARMEGLFLALILGVLLGGRIGFMLLYDFGELVRNPLRLFAVWEGGMSSHGGFAGVALAVWIATRRMGVDLWHVGDLVASAAPAGLLFGRIANFINGELWGKPAEAPWAVLFPAAPLDRSAAYVYVAEWGYHANPRHPSQLYAAFLEGLVLLAIMQCRFWYSGRSRPSGQLVGEFLCAYAVLRVIGEVFREPDASPVLGLSRGTAYSLVALVLGALIIFLARARRLPGGPAEA